jgi:hypothetical protein
MDGKPANGVALGFLLGLANALVVSVGLSAMDPGNRVEMAAIIFVFGIVPASVVGVLLGLLAERLARAPVWLRRVVLVVPALLVVGLLGSMFGLQSAVVVSCIPTTAAAFWLERATRTREAPPVPVVAVRR